MPLKTADAVNGNVSEQNSIISTEGEPSAKNQDSVREASIKLMAIMKAKRACRNAS